MSTPRIPLSTISASRVPVSLVIACLCLLALASFMRAQSVPTTYTITQNGQTPGLTLTIYRSGSKALMVQMQPAQGATPATQTDSLYDLAAGTNVTWDPNATPLQCSAGRFSGDWGDPFAMTADLTKGIASGELKPAGTETIAGIPTQIYAANSPQGSEKVWFDQKDGLVIRATYAAPGAPLMTLVDITKFSFAPPSPSLFVLPSACAGVKPPPTAADVIADETGDSAGNWVNAIYGPGSANSCTIVVRVVAAKTMAPIDRKYQAAIDTTYEQNNPPHYEFGVARDGTTSYSGGGLHEITNQVHNGILRIDNPPAYFMLGLNFPTPNRGGSVGMVYRQCFGPVTNLYWVVKDPANPDDGGDWLYAKSGKYAAH